MSNMFYILSANMAQATGKDEMACRGMLRMSILDSVEQLRQTADLNQVAVCMQTMAYEDWKAVIEGVVLSQRLVGIGIKRPADVVARLRQTLVEKQSLLTMSVY